MTLFLELTRNKTTTALDAKANLNNIFLYKLFTRHNGTGGRPIIFRTPHTNLSMVNSQKKYLCYDIEEQVYVKWIESSPWNHRHYHQLSSSVLCRSSTAGDMSTVPMFDPIVIDGRSAPRKRHREWKSDGTNAMKQKTLDDPSP
jgi:hypothetical protein